MSTVADYETKTEELKNYLDKWIGFYYNQTYYCGWFWTNVATPINLALTILTAMNAAQSSTQSFIPEGVYTILSFTTMILTTLNSYFRPNVRSIDANTRLVKWIGLGHRLEYLVFDVMEPGKDKFEAYKKLLVDMDDFVCVQAAQERNFITDWWHSLMRWHNGEDSELWLSWGSKPKAPPAEPPADPAASHMEAPTTMEASTIKNPIIHALETVVIAPKAGQEK